MKEYKSMKEMKIIKLLKKENRIIELF